MSFVLDNSVTMRWAFQQPGSDLTYALKILNRLAHESAVAPSLWPLEVTNVLAVSERKGFLLAEESQAFICQLEVLPIEIDNTTHQVSFSRILAMARLYKLSSYDAAYLELASRRKLPLATLDKELKKAARNVQVEII